MEQVKILLSQDALSQNKLVYLTEMLLFSWLCVNVGVMRHFD